MDWTVRARLRPKPEEQPVISQVSGLLGLVNVVDILGGCLRGSVRNLARMRLSLFRRNRILKDSVRYLSQCEVPLINVLGFMKYIYFVGQALDKCQHGLKTGLSCHLIPTSETLRS